MIIIIFGCTLKFTYGNLKLVGFFDGRRYNEGERGRDMTTGEKISALRKKKGLTQEQLAEILNVSRQSVSRWEMDIAFPETEKLIKLSRILNCSIDFLLNNDLQEQELKQNPKVLECYDFIRECGCFFLATSTQNIPKLRPMGFIYGDDRFLYIATDSRKRVYDDLMKNPKVEIASYNLITRKWIRISGVVEKEISTVVRENMEFLYPMIQQEFAQENEIYSVIFRIQVEHARID